MTPSLRSRLIVGMLLGMAVLLAAAGVTTYAVQRQQLYQAFDDSLLHSANSLSLLIHPGPFGIRFESGGLERLPAGKIREGSVFQFWGDQPISVFEPRRRSDGERPKREGPPPKPDEEEETEDEGPFRSGGPPPLPRFDDHGPGGDRDGSRFRPPPDEDDFAPHGPPMPRGELVVRAPALGEADLPKIEADMGTPQFKTIVMPGGMPGRAVGVKFEVRSPDLGFRRREPAEILVVVAAKTDSVAHQLRFLAALLAVTAVGTMGLAGGIAWFVVSRGLHPLSIVATKIGDMDETGLKQRIPTEGTPREIKPVIRQLNGLLERLDEAFDRERSLTADVAHELRTPVSEIRAIAEITLSRLRDPEEYRQALQETREAVRTLQDVIERLLILARMEAGQMKLEMETVRVKPFLQKHWELLDPQAKTRNIAFEDLLDEDTSLFADPRLLTVVLNNALGNAVTYTPRDGQIRAEVCRVGSRVRLSLSNTGCPLSEEEAERVFDRFWRADVARSKTGLNCGLGLTLVRRAMEAMGGEAFASVSDDRWFVLALDFDAAEEDG